MTNVITRFKIKGNQANTKGQMVNFIYMDDFNQCTAAIIFKDDLWYTCTLRINSQKLVMYYPAKTEKFALELMEKEVKRQDHCLVISGNPIKLPDAIAKLKIEGL